MSALPRKSGHSGSSASCYDPINQSNLYDFEGTVAHEISEVLGRIFLSSKSYSAYDFFYYSSKGVHDFAANGGGYFSIDGGKTDLANFNTANGGDGADWVTGGTSNSGGSLYDAFNAFSTPAQISPVTQTDLTVLQALGFQLNSPPAAVTTQPTSGLTNTQTTVQNTRLLEIRQASTNRSLC